jgi:glycosyltransferase involved in cell wall biosynthesis
MRILQILPGSGDRFYCENCVRDNSLVRALAAAGQEVIPAPLYLPTLNDPVDLISRAPIFYGGINSYLQQKSGFFRWTPRWVDALLDAKLFLRWAAKGAGSVRASGLGELTLSIMRGEAGNQAKELGRLLRWLEKQPRPDVVHLSSPLLIGIGIAVKKRFGAPLVCTLQDEDVWIDAMEEPARSRCWEVMAAGTPDVDAYVSVSHTFGEAMRVRLKIDPARLKVVPVGIDVSAPPPAARPAAPAIGYLARMSRGMGFGLLADAFLLLKKEPRYKPLRLHATGGMSDDDRPFHEELLGRFEAQGVARDVRIYEDFDSAHRRAFMESLTVFSAPTPSGVAFGTHLLEALACAVPVVQPRAGSFPELVDATGGGVLYEPNEPEPLARALASLLDDEPRRAELGRKGRESVVKSYGLDTMARKMIEVYEGVVR